MDENYNKPMTLDDTDFEIWGIGDPSWGDPSLVCTRRFSRHIVMLCRKKPMSAAEIAAELNVPTVYVEEELEILTKGEKGNYGLLRRLDNGKYAINIVLLGKEEIQKAHAIYMEQIPAIGNIIFDFIEKKKEEYLAFPYRNRKVDWNLILWQQIKKIAGAFSDNVERILGEKYFAGIKKSNRPFSVFGHLDYGKSYGGCWDGVYAGDICGYTQVRLDNIGIFRIKQHFSWDLNVANEPKIKLALRAIGGLDINTLSDWEKEYAAMAVECGYLYREGETLYTKILVSDLKDADRLFDISNELSCGYFEAEAQAVAEKISDLIHKNIPDYLFEDWALANLIANRPVLDTLVEFFIEKGVMVPPKDGIGAEGCWMAVEE